MHLPQFPAETLMYTVTAITLERACELVIMIILTNARNTRRKINIIIIDNVITRLYVRYINTAQKKKKQGSLVSSSTPSSGRPEILG